MSHSLQLHHQKGIFGSLGVSWQSLCTSFRQKQNGKKKKKKSTHVCWKLSHYTHMETSLFSVLQEWQLDHKPTPISLLRHLPVNVPTAQLAVHQCRWSGGPHLCVGSCHFNSPRKLRTADKTTLCCFIGNRAASFRNIPQNETVWHVGVTLKCQGFPAVTVLNQSLKWFCTFSFLKHSWGKLRTNKDLWRS